MVAIAAHPLPLPTYVGQKPNSLRRFWASSPPGLAEASSIRSFLWSNNGGGNRVPRFLLPRASISTRTEGSSDRDLRLVLELATDEELFELENILYGPSYFSPLLKSIATKADLDYFLEEADDQQRENYIQQLESRFFFLAADARSTLRGWRPSYRNVLLGVRRKLKISCSNKLSTEDLEVEIFLHLLQEYSSQESGSISSLWEDTEIADNGGSLGVGLSHWKLQLLSVFKTGAKEFQEMILKGGGMLTVSRILQLLSSRFSGKMIMEAANYQIKREIIKRGGQMAAINLESRAALLVARKGLTGAASRYLGLRSLMFFLGPLLWGTFLADVVIQSLGTDYARVLRAIYAFAQIRLTRSYSC
ncbi:hypothetical protein KSP39_PZI014608 [Platanthera zijinensis]|uniref:Uncharacterized protein n=1 Tax=Platanthera zijinensis TaxID=2320716 RepID=A0AAP0BAZ5_9ASPA